MELEQRVQALEQEVEVLKNQIKATLLDIQEQILTNAYPSLRAENSALPRIPVQPNAQPVAQPTLPVRQPSIGDEPIVLPKTAPVKSVSLEAIDPDQAEPDAEPEPPKVVAVRPVNLNKAPNSTPTNNTNNIAPSQQTAAELTAWANRQVKEIGPVGTAELIRTYAEQGKITPDVADALFNSITQDDPEHPRMGENGTQRQGSGTSVSASGQNGNGHAPNGAKRANGKGLPGLQKAQSAPDQSLPFEPLPDQVDGPSKPTPKRRKGTRPHIPAAEARTMDVLPTNGQRASSQGPAQPAVPQPPAPHAQMLHFEEVEAPRKLVLKLIAGVQNAGAGIGRKKNQNG